MDPTTKNRFEHFRLAYIEAMLWSSTASDGETPLDEIAAELTEEAHATIHADCLAFWERFGDKLTRAAYIGRSMHGSVAENAGHDFWLTRAGHGAGFWDGDWAEPIASEMDAYCRSLPPCDPYDIADEIHLSACRCLNAPGGAQ